VSASRKHLTGAAAARAAVLVCASGWLAASQASTVDFPLLPALKTELAIESLLLDITRNGDRLLVVGEQGNILWSDDNGQSWTQADVPVSLAITSVTFAGPGRAWATAHDGFLLRSTDNGASWEVKLSGSDVATLSVGALETQIEALRSAVDTATPETLEEAEWALDDGLFALDEATEAIDEGMNSPMLKVWFADDNIGYALGAYGVFLRTADGGETWVADSSRLDNPDKYHLYAFTRSSAGTLLIAGEAGTLLRSLDNGNQWERLESPYAGSFFGSVATSDGSLLIFGLRGNVFRSTDEGVSWAAVDTRDQRTLMCGAASNDGSVVLAGAAGVVLESRDAGVSFRVVPTEGNRVYSGVSLAPDGSIQLVGFGGVSAVARNSDE
jgi:photosystem II stability/assembly factor-like uncharacterized protein